MDGESLKQENSRTDVLEATKHEVSALSDQHLADALEASLIANNHEAIKLYIAEAAKRLREA